MCGFLIAQKIRKPVFAGLPEGRKAASAFGTFDIGNFFGSAWKPAKDDISRRGVKNMKNVCMGELCRSAALKVRMVLKRKNHGEN